MLYQDRFLKRAAAFQILTSKERQDIAPYVHTQIISEIPNYVTPFLKSAERPSWWRSSFDGRTIYLFFGRIHEKKACRELAEAWANLCRKDQAFADQSALVFCGWNDGLSGFEDYVQKLDAELGNALYAGPQFGGDKLRSLSAASFFILPSKSEGLPMAILEAWGAGLPVIMTRECNLPEGFVSGAALETGFDVEEISKSLSKAHKILPEERRDMGQRGMSIVREEYSKERVGDALMTIYTSVVGKKSRSSVVPGMKQHEPS